MSYRSRDNETRVYVGNLPDDVSSRELEDLFYKYGKIECIDLKTRTQGPPFAFIDFDDPRDAEDAVSSRDGYKLDGYKIRVEFTRGRGPYRGGGGFRGGRGGFRGRGRGDRGPPQRSGHRVMVTGLPATGSWQDLKDHLRDAGEICFADVYRDGTGVVEFIRYDDMKYAMRNFDDTKFTSHKNETAYIRVKEDSGSKGGRGRSRSRSRSPYGRRGSPTYSPVRRSSYSRSKSRSRSRSPSANR